jgi:hypothetical protein
LGNRKAQNVLAGIVLFFALITLLFQSRIYDWWELHKLLNSDKPAVAELTGISKNVKIRLPESLTYYRARNHWPLHVKDSISTDVDSTAIITFKSGLEILLEPNSLVIIEDPSIAGGGSMELSFLRGSVKIINNSQGRDIHLPPTAISRPKNNADSPTPPEIDLNVLNQTPTPAPTLAPTPSPHIDFVEKHKKPEPKKVEEKETLPDAYIASIIRNQRNYLNRCYAQYLRLNPDARGRIDCALTIEPDGTISTARVVGSTIPDPSLQQCVVSTLQRARFKSFNGDPIIVNYPINFE